MFKISLATVLLTLSFHLNSLFARDEIVLTIPTSGTVYLEKLIETITKCNTIHPSSPIYYPFHYEVYMNDDSTVVIGHVYDPIVYNFLTISLYPEAEKLILIRDPRDMVLSAIDYIDKSGVAAWPYLPDNINNQQWKASSKKQKAEFLLEKFPVYTGKTPLVSGLSMMKSLCEIAACTIVKYEDLSMRNPDRKQRCEAVQKIANFFNTPINLEQADRVAKLSWGKRGFRKGNIERYKTETDVAFRAYLEQQLGTYIEYFKYAL